MRRSAIPRSPSRGPAPRAISAQTPAGSGFPRPVGRRASGPHSHVTRVHPRIEDARVLPSPPSLLGGPRGGRSTAARRRGGTPTWRRGAVPSRGGNPVPRVAPGRADRTRRKWPTVWLSTQIASLPEACVLWAARGFRARNTRPRRSRRLARRAQYLRWARPTGSPLPTRLSRWLTRGGAGAPDMHHAPTPPSRRSGVRGRALWCVTCGDTSFGEPSSHTDSVIQRGIPSMRTAHPLPPV